MMTWKQIKKKNFDLNCKKSLKNLTRYPESTLYNGTETCLSSLSSCNQEDNFKSIAYCSLLKIIE